MRPTRTDKRGLLAPQPAADLASLDFAHQSEAMDRALALSYAAKTDDQASAAAGFAADCIDKLLAIPARTPAEIAQKLRGYAWRFSDAGDLSRPEDRRRLLASDDQRDDDAKGLLAMYLDLTTCIGREEWERAEARYTAAIDGLSRLPKGTDWDDDCPQYVEFVAAREGMMTTPAPDAAAMAFKLGALLDYGYLEQIGDHSAEPGFLKRLLDNRALDGGRPVVLLLKDALRLSGQTQHPVFTLEAGQ